MIPRFVAELFPRHVRVRGEDYAATGRVRLGRPEADAIRATVRGAVTYDVVVERSGDRATLGCSCPYALDNGVCKHLWAVLVTADVDHRVEPVLAGVDAVYFASDADALDLDTGHRADDALLEPEPPRTLESQHPPPSGHRGRDRGGKRPEWARVIAEARSHAIRPPDPPRPWPAHRRLVYLLDLDTTAYSPDGIVVQLATEKEQRDGTFGEPKPLRTNLEALERLPDPSDRLLVQMLCGTRRANEWSVRRATTAIGFVVGPGAFDTTIRLLCESGRFRARRAAEGTLSEPLAWDDGPPWRVRLRVAPAAEPRMLALEARLERDDATMPLAEPTLLHESGLLLAHARIARFDPEGNFPLIAGLRRAAHPIALRESELPALLGRLYELPRVPALELPAGVSVTETAPAPIPVLALVAEPQHWGPPRFRLERSFDYDGIEVEAERPGDTVLDEATLRVVRRDRATEQRALDRLQELGGQPAPYGSRPASSLLIAPSRVEAMVETLLDEGWRITVDGVRRRAPTALRARVSSGVDWFSLDGDVAFGDATLPLPALLEALRGGSRAVVLADGSEGRISDAWRRRLAPLVAAMRMANGEARFQPGQAPLLDALLATMPEVEVDERFARARAELRRFERVEPASEPPGFTGKLRAYQSEGLGWLHFLRRFDLGGCLADDMGLGKTVQVLALLAARKADGAGPSLIVVPRSLVFNWKEEAARFAPALRVLDHSGAQRERGAPDVRAVDVVITTYGTLRQDVPALREVEFDYVILDEAQAIKNATTASAKAARLLRGRHRLALTGTPIENRLEELWSLIDFLNPGMLGTVTAFRTMTRQARGARGARPAAAEPAEGDPARALLARALRPIILRRTKSLVAAELPARVEQTLPVELEGEQRRQYDELLTHYRRSLLPEVSRRGVERSRMQILEALLRLRQAACHPALIDASRAASPSAKLDALVPMLVEVAAEGHRALVFSQFTKFLALLRARLDGEGVAYEYLDGATRDRQARVERFQAAGGAPVFLISLRAGGQGLNLTSADYVYLLDPWWNPAVEAQAIDRAHRIGQERQVIATRLVAHDTIEEKILELQRTKRELADAILSEDQGLLAGIGVEELQALLG